MSDRIAFIVTTDGRGEFLEHTLPSWDQATGNFCTKVMIDDSGDLDYRDWLVSTFVPLGWRITFVGRERQGYNTAMRRIREVGLASGADYIFHVEDDFILNRPIDLSTITNLFAENPNTFAQMAFVRQPWYENEIESGGVIKALLDQGCNFNEKTNGKINWIEHVAVWTANPNIMPIEVANIEYPQGLWSEASLMRKLREETSLVCAYYGKLDDEPMVTHIGDYKKGNGY